MENKKEEVGKLPLNILLAEDDEADVEIALRAFEKSSLANNLYVVNDGQQAMDFLLHHGEFENQENNPKPDIILLDINMPRMNGFEFLLKIKENVEYKGIPVIMLSSSRNKSDIATCYNQGAAGYIPKPINYEEFFEIVESFNQYWHNISRLPRNGAIFY